MKIPNVVSEPVNESRHMVHVQGKTRNIGGLGDNEEEATQDFLEKAEKVRKSMGEEAFAHEFNIEIVGEESSTMTVHKSEGIQPKSATEAELMADKKPSTPLEAVVEKKPADDKITGDKPAGNLTGDKGQTSNDLTGTKP